MLYTHNVTYFLLCTQFFFYQKHIDGLQVGCFSMFKLSKAKMFSDVS